MSVNALQQNEKELNELRGKARQLKKHSEKQATETKKELKKVEEKIVTIQKAQENKIQLPEQQVAELTELKATKETLVKEIQHHEQIANNIKQILETPQYTVPLEKTETQAKEEKSAQPIEIKEPQPAAEKNIKEKQAEKKEPSAPIPATPEESKTTPEAKKETDPHVFADVTIKEAPENKKPEIPKQEEIKPSTPVEEAKTKMGKDDLDSITVDPAAELKNAVIENLEARKALSEVTIAKKEELLIAVEKNKALKSSIPEIKKEIDAEKAQLEKIKAELGNPDTITKSLEGKTGKENEFPKEKTKLIEDIKTDTKKIKENTDKLKGEPLPELKEGLLPNSSKFKWLRRVLNLWPLATYPVFVAWAAMIMPTFVFAVYGLPLAGAAFGIFCAGYFLPKIINKGLDKYKEYKERKAEKARELGQEPELGQEQTKEQTKDRTEIAKEQKREGKEEIAKPEKKGEKKTLTSRASSSSLAADSIGPEQAKASADQKLLDNQTQAGTSKREKVVNFLKKNWRPVAVIVGVTVAAGLAGVFLMPAIAPILGGAAIGGAFTVGTVALMGAGISLVTQLIDHFVLKRVQNNLENKENEKVNALEKDCREKIKAYEQDKDKTVEQNLIQGIREAGGYTKNQPERNQPAHERASVQRDTVSRTATINTEVSRQNTAVTNEKIIQMPQPSAQRSQSISGPPTPPPMPTQSRASGQQPLKNLVDKGKDVSAINNKKESPAMEKKPQKRESKVL